MLLRTGWLWFWPPIRASQIADVLITALPIIMLVI